MDIKLLPAATSALTDANMFKRKRIGLTHLVTHDDDFSDVDTVTVWRPMDI